jgi:hypothetical protein
MNKTKILTLVLILILIATIPALAIKRQALVLMHQP